MATRQPPSAGVRLMKLVMRRMSSTAITIRRRLRFVEATLDGQQVGVGAGLDAAEHRMARVESQRIGFGRAGQ
jgi:hypothetical protein